MSYTTYNVIQLVIYINLYIQEVFWAKLVYVDYLLTTRNKMSTDKWECKAKPSECACGWHTQKDCPYTGVAGRKVGKNEKLPKRKDAKKAKKAPAKKAAAAKAPAKKAPAKKAPSKMSEAEIYDELAALSRRKAKLKKAQAAQESESESESESEEE